MVNHNIEAAALVSCAVVVLLDKYGKIVADAVKVAAFQFPPLAGVVQRDSTPSAQEPASHVLMKARRLPTACRLPTVFATMDTQDQMARHAPHAQLEHTRISAVGLLAHSAQLENMQTK